MALLPILIGSHALKTSNELSDVDIIFNEEIPKCDNVKSITDTKIIEWCNKDEHKQIIKMNDYDVIVCPTKLLYVIYKSHIARIINYFAEQDENIKIWLKYHNSYLKLREMLDYKEMDRILFSDDYEKTEENVFLREIFHERFDECIQKHGETEISLEENQEEFFKDNVKRFIDHDELHVIMNDGQEPIFKKILNEKNVGLDKDKFFALTIEERRTMIAQEILVLIFERNIIPTLKTLGKEIDKKLWNLIASKFKDILTDVFCNFATNLCGQKHYFLRWYVIDHGKEFLNPITYNFQKYFQEIIKKLGIDMCEDITKSLSDEDKISIWTDYKISEETRKNIHKISNFHVLNDFSYGYLKDMKEKIETLDNKLHDNIFKNTKLVVAYHNKNICLYVVEGSLAGKGIYIENDIIKLFILEIKSENNYIVFDKIDIENEIITTKNMFTKNEIIKIKDTITKNYEIKILQCWCYTSGCSDMGYHRCSNDEETIDRGTEKKTDTDYFEFLNFAGIYDYAKPLMQKIASSILKCDNNYNDYDYREFIAPEYQSEYESE